MALTLLQVHATLLDDIIHTPAIVKLLSGNNSKVILLNAISWDNHLDNVSTEITIHILSVQKTETLAQPPLSMSLTTTLQRTEIIQSFISIRSDILILSVLVINPLAPFTAEIIIKDFQHLIISQSTLL